MCGVDTLVHKQPSKGVTSILVIYHPSQFINGYMGEIGLPLHKKSSKGITSILATQHYKDVSWVNG